MGKHEPTKKKNKPKTDKEIRERRRKKIKTAVKIGVAVAGIGLAAYGAKKLNDKLLTSDTVINFLNDSREKRRNREKEYALNNEKWLELRTRQTGKSFREQNRIAKKLDREINKAGGLEQYFGNHTTYKALMADWDAKNPKYQKMVRTYVGNRIKLVTQDSFNKEMDKALEEWRNRNRK